MLLESKFHMVDAGVEKMLDSDKKGYYLIENYLDLNDILNNLDLLFQDGILVLQGVEHKEILTQLSDFELHENLDIKYQDKTRLTFGLFFAKKVPLHNITIIFNDKSKKVLLDIIAIHVPYQEVCENILYINPKSKNCILEFSVLTSDTLFVSRDETIDDNIFRKFCESLNVNSYSVNEFY